MKNTNIILQLMYSHFCSLSLLKVEILKNGIHLKQFAYIVDYKCEFQKEWSPSHTFFIVPIVFNTTSCYKELPDKYFCCDGAFVIIHIPPAEVGLSILLGPFSPTAALLPQTQLEVR